MKTTRKLSLETLEDRQLLAADLSFDPLAGDSYQNASNIAEVKSLSGTDLGSGRIKGLSGTDLGSSRITAAHLAVFAELDR
jgi:hypothetical protein